MAREVIGQWWESTDTVLLNGPKVHCLLNIYVFTHRFVLLSAWSEKLHLVVDRD